MSSAVRGLSQVPINKLYITTAAVQSTIYSEPSTTATALSPVTWANNTVGISLSTATGGLILRDMGKNVYFGSANNGASQSTILRKVQLVTNAGTGTGMGSTSEAGEYFTGYISLGGQTYGGGDASRTAVVRLN